MVCVDTNLYVHEICHKSWGHGGVHTDADTVANPTEFLRLKHIFPQAYFAVHTTSNSMESYWSLYLRIMDEAGDSIDELDFELPSLESYIRWYNPNVALRLMWLFAPYTNDKMDVLLRQ